MWDHVPVCHKDLQLSVNAGFRPREGLLLKLDEQRLVVDNHLSEGLKSEPDPLLPQHLSEALENSWQVQFLLKANVHSHQTKVERHKLFLMPGELTVVGSSTDHG